MALMAVIFSSMLGALAGLTHLAFFGAGVGQAFMTYLTISIALSSILLTVAFAREYRAESSGDDVEQTDLELWQDWQLQESMEAEQRNLSFPEAEADQKPEKRRSA